MGILNREQIQSLEPEKPPKNPSEALNQAKQTMLDTGCWSKHQQMGRRWPIGCVALEVTQRCNLDCTLCYLSEHSEAVKDIPLTEVLHRIDLIFQYYGPNTDIQVTGGDPTLRQRDELVTIIHYIKDKNMRSTLMTNGIRATRSLLSELTKAGLNDVVFHVDTTQEIKGYQNEIELNEIRKKYIERAKGLGLSIMFNTTIHDSNYHEIPELIKFFITQAKFIRTVSFQLQADTGRGTQGQRTMPITPDTVWSQIERGAATTITHDAIMTGHPACNRYGMGLVLDQHCIDLFDDKDFVTEIQYATATLIADRKHKWKTMINFINWLICHPRYILPFIKWMIKKIWLIKQLLLKSKTLPATLSFFVHNFMDACSLEHDRIKACVFKTMTSEGPLSMCLYNAKRDDYILKPVPITNQHYWQPLTGEISTSRIRPQKIDPVFYPLKKLKGRTRRKIRAT